MRARSRAGTGDCGKGCELMDVCEDASSAAAPSGNAHTVCISSRRVSRGKFALLATIVMAHEVDGGQHFVVAMKIEERGVLPSGALSPTRTTASRNPRGFPVDDADAAAVDDRLSQVDHVLL